MNSNEDRVITKYQLLTYKEGKSARSYYFLNPAPDIYQIISDMGFSVLTTEPELKSGFDEEKIHLISGNEIKDSYIFNTGKFVTNNENERRFNLDGEKSSLSFSTISDNGKFYIYCPNLKFKV